MPNKLLDPTLDVVFKLLLLKRQELLRDMIESVLALTEPIESLEVLNPEIPKDFPVDKSIVLDIRVLLKNGHQIDLEMQSTVPTGTRPRFLYYWARAYADSIDRGEDYTLLRPCISILWFKEALLKAPRFHSVFHLSEDHEREVFSPEIEFHVLELPKLHLADEVRQVKLERWARFLGAQTTSELEALAAEDDIMTTAKQTLEELSSDSRARRLAREREMSMVTHRHLLAASREEGREEGIEKGREEGEAKGLVLAVHNACEFLGIAVDSGRDHQIASLTLEQLKQLIYHLKTERKWPDEV